MANNISIAAIIPARYASTRFPGKPLVQINGKTMIQCVYDQVKSTPEIAEVIVATDDDRIEAEVIRFGGKVVPYRNTQAVQTVVMKRIRNSTVHLISLSTCRAMNRLFNPSRSLRLQQS